MSGIRLRVAFACGLAIAVSAAALLRGQDEGVFTGIPSPQAVPAAEASVIRRRWVTVDLDRVRDRPSAVLNLFDDVRLRAALDRVEQTPNGYVWVGRLADIAGSSVTLSVIDTVMAGTVSTGDAHFTIRYAGNGVHVVQQVDPTQFPPELPPVVPPQGAVQAQDVEVLADDGSQIDVLIVYTQAARALQGGASAIQALVNLGVSETNQAYANSGAIQRLRLVHTQEVNYTETASTNTTLEHLRGTSDGFMDEVHALRNTYAADLVHVISNNPPGCGVAYLMSTISTSFAPFGFGVTHYTCVSPNYTLAHELGHNMGLNHDTYVEPSNVPFPYGHGYVNPAAFLAGAPASKRWRDVMAYNDRCAASGFNCQRILFFSNPLLTHTGDPLGDASTADNVRALDSTRVTVANLRAGTVTSSSLSINDITLRERNNTRTATFTVSLSALSGSTITVSYATADGTATTGGGDYLGASGVLTFPAGTATRQVTVTITGDGAVESDETFTVNLSAPSGASIADGAGVARIVNDDFTDASLAGGSVRAVHIAELRAAVNGTRAEKGLFPYAFSDPTLTPRVTSIKAAHVNELRAALAEAYSAASQPLPGFTDGSLAATVIKATHIAELRTAVANLP